MPRRTVICSTLSLIHRRGRCNGSTWIQAVQGTAVVSGTAVVWGVDEAMAMAMAMAMAVKGMA